MVIISSDVRTYVHVLSNRLDVSYSQTGVHFFTGQFFDMKAITEAAHNKVRIRTYIHVQCTACVKIQYTSKKRVRRVATE